MCSIYQGSMRHFRRYTHRMIRWLFPQPTMYQIIVSDTVEGLTREVEGLMRAGWKCQGGVLRWNDGGEEAWERVRYGQAIVL
jgi:hypothetical protein